MKKTTKELRVELSAGQTSVLIWTVFHGQSEAEEALVGTTPG